MVFTINIFGLIACFLFVNVYITPSSAAPDRVVCYFGSWSVYRVGEGKFAISDIPADLCTHLIYSFVTVTDSGLIKVMDPYADLTENYGMGGFEKVMNLKAANPSLKVLVAMGGYNEGSERYSKIFSDASLRNSFALNAVTFLKTHGFHGLDLDWEYPARRGGMPADKENFVELIKALDTEFRKFGFLLTAAVSAAEPSVVESYDVHKISKYLDFINIMAYDFHGSYDGKTGHNAPLLKSKSEYNTINADFTVDASIKAWIKLGAPSAKLVIGVGAYGRTFTLASQNCINPYCQSSGAGKAGPFSKEAGLLAYYEICNIENTDSAAKVHWDEEALVPYLVTGDQWISYDNERSAQLKIDYIKEHDLGGVMIWSIDFDDFKGSCGKGKYPILTVLSNGIKGNAI